MSSIPYNSKAYLDAKVSMTNHGTVDAGRQMQSPASAGSRGLAKTTQFSLKTRHRCSWDRKP